MGVITQRISHLRLAVKYFFFIFFGPQFQSEHPSAIHYFFLSYLIFCHLSFARFNLLLLFVVSAIQCASYGKTQ